MNTIQETANDLLQFCGNNKFATIYADPPWRFQNRTGKIAPEHKRLSRYETMTVSDIEALPVSQIATAKSHLYLSSDDSMGISVQRQYHLGKNQERWRA